MSEVLAVFTGDLVGSTQAEPERVEAIFERLKTADAHIAHWPGETDLPRLERFRGDGWQAVVRRPGHVLRAALLFAAVVRSVGKSCTTRIAIGVGPAEALNRDSLGASDGAAFRMSGRLLEDFPRHGVIAARTRSPAADGWAEAALSLAGQIAAGWTAKQAEVVAALLLQDPPSQSELAARLGVTKQTVQGHFETASGPALLAVCEHLEAMEDATG